MNLRAMVAAQTACCVVLLAPAAQARGVSPYLPLQMAPEMERQIERVLILGDKPVMSRPIAAATVLDALPAACRIDQALCKSVRAYLHRYMGKLGIDHASVEGASVTGSENQTVPNRYGLSRDSEYQISGAAHWQVNDHVIVSAGGVVDADGGVPTGSMVSFGYEYAQVDVGYRPRWYSPFTDSAMLISTEAQTLPSVTLSNYTPLTRWQVSYEIFLSEMESSNRIAFKNRTTSGKPRLGGMRLSIQPAPGWSLGANRLLQFGGGEREGSFTDFLRAMWRPRDFDNQSDTLGQDQQFGNQVASFTSRFIFPGNTPFAAYLEYAGEDTSYEGNTRLGNSALSIGLHFPRLWRRFDLTVEASEWQNTWYTNTLYGDGLTQDGRVIGHWGADERVFGDAVGANALMARLGWAPSFGGLLQLRARTVENESYSSNDYERGYEVGVSYSRPFRQFTAGAEFVAGRDVFGGGFSRLAGFVRLGDEWGGGDAGGDWQDASRPKGAELFVDAGLATSEVTVRLGDGSDKFTTSREVTPHLGFGARRAVSERSDLGVRLELDRIDDHMLLAVRAVDYRYRFQNNPLAVGMFLGAARYDLATPAYGYYLGAGVQWRDLIKGWDLGVDLRYADKVARDKFPNQIPSDPGLDPRPDSFYDITSATLSLSYRW